MLKTIDVENLGHLSIDYYVEKAYLNYQVRDIENAKISIAEALTQIETVETRNPHEKIYRKKYLECIIAGLFGHSAETTVVYEGVELNKVKNRTRSLFPLRNHPAWEE